MKGQMFEWWVSLFERSHIDSDQCVGPVRPLRYLDPPIDISSPRSERRSERNFPNCTHSDVPVA
jgi:hypothetical protein